MDQTSTTLRPLLLSIAYRMLGSFRDAEDVVQEAYLRLHREPVEVVSPKAFLTFTGDGGGEATGPAHPVVGAVKVARLLIGAFDKLRDHGIQIEHVHVGANPAPRMHTPTNETTAVRSLLITDSTIVAIHGVVNPDKLTRL